MQPIRGHRLLRLQIEVEQLFAQLYFDQASTTKVLRDAQLGPQNYDLSESMAVAWSEIVQAAIADSTLSSIFSAALADFPDHPRLRELAGETAAQAEALGQGVRSRSESRWKPKGNAPYQVLFATGGFALLIVLVDWLSRSKFALYSVLSIVLIAFVAVIRRMGAGLPAATPSLTSPRLVQIDLDAGFFGGLGGGAVTGVLLSVLYHRTAAQALPLGRILVETTLSFGVGVAVLGLLVAAFTGLFARLLARFPGGRWIFNEITASLAAGLIAGVAMGLPIAWHFGKYQFSRPFASPTLLISAILPGSVIIGVFIAIWNVRPLAGHLVRSIVANVLLAWIVGFLCAGLFDMMNLNQYLYDSLYRGGTIQSRMKGGLIYGVILGGIAGLFIGISIFVTRHWRIRRLRSVT